MLPTLPPTTAGEPASPPPGTPGTPGTATPGVRSDGRRTLKRMLTVWGVFALASVLAIAVLRVASVGAGGGGAAFSPGLPGAAGAWAGTRAGTQGGTEHAAALRTNSVTPRFADLDRKRWRAIVIHHSGTPGGDAASIERRHLQDGLTGLGYHFIIGNGQGLEDGQVSVGYRWDRQLAGAHVAQGGSRDAAFYNEHAVAICLIGNGERRAFTERQVRELVALVRQLQASLGIPAAEVHLHSALSGVASPGQFFPVNEVVGQILP